MGFQRLYNPALLTKDELKATFTVRKTTYTELIEHLAAHKPGEPCKHTIIIGARGTGKTTLGLRILYQIEDDPVLSLAWQVVPFNEESYGISDAAEFWITALNHLSFATNDSTWSEYSLELTTLNIESSQIEAYALDAINQFCDETGKRLILFVENLDGILRQFRSNRDAYALRAVLTANHRLFLLGTANSEFAEIKDYRAPLYEFFKLVRLVGLSRCESEQLVESIAAQLGQGAFSNNNKVIEGGRMEAIRRLTGGNPRLIAMAGQILIESPTQQINVLERLIDEQTPYFKARIEGLPVQARKVLHQLAEGWQPMLAREVASRVRLGTSQVSAQLRVLVDRGYVSELRLNGEAKNRYELLDRFFNIYYLYRLSRSTQDRLRWFLAFLYDLLGAPAIRNLCFEALHSFPKKQFNSSKFADFLNVLVSFVIRDEKFENREQWIKRMLKVVDDYDVEQLQSDDFARSIHVWTVLGNKLRQSGRISDAIFAYARVIEVIAPNVQSELSKSSSEFDEAGKIVDFTELGGQTVRFIFVEVFSNMNLDDLIPEDRLRLGYLSATIGALALIGREDILAKDALGFSMECSNIEPVDSKVEHKMKSFLLAFLLETYSRHLDLGFAQQLSDVVVNLAKMQRIKERSSDEFVLSCVIGAGKILIGAERFDLVEDLCRWVTTEFPERDEGWRLYVVWALGQTGDGWILEAGEYVDRALAIGSKDPRNYYLGYLVAAKLDEWEDGLERLGACFRVDPKFRRGHWSAHVDLFVRAACVLNRKVVREFIEEYQLTQELEPLWYALHEKDVVQSVPLPREIVEAISHIRKRFDCDLK